MSQKRQPEIERVDSEKEDLFELGDKIALDAVWQTDLTSGRTTVSRNTCSLLGHPPNIINNADNSHHWILSQVHPKDARRVKAAVLRHWKHRTPFKLDFRFRSKDGKYRWLEARGQATWDKEEKPVHFAGHLSDIHERKLTTETIKLRESRLNEAQRLINAGDWELDLVTNQLRWSPQIYSIFEIDPKDFEVSSESFLAAVHPEDRDVVHKTYLDSVKNRNAYEIIHRLLMRDGRIKYVEEHGYTIYDSKGSPLRSYGTVQDITEREEAKQKLHQLNEKLETLVEARTMGLEDQSKELERINGELEARVKERTRKLESANQFLEQSEQRFRTLFEGMRDGLAFCDPSMRLSLCNKEFERLTGYTRKEMEGVNLLEKLVHPEDHARLVKNNAKRLAGKKVDHNYEFRWIRKDGEIRLIDGNFDTVCYEDKLVGVQGVCRDITERKIAEQELRKLNEELELRVRERTQDLEKARDSALAANQAKSEFLSRVSHELRTPLNGIIGFSKLLQMSQLAERAEKNVDLIHKSGKHLLDLINDMLDLSRIESGSISLSFTSVNIDELLREIISLVDHMANERQISLCLDNMVDKKREWKADRKRLRQILWNLASNGIKYNRAGGNLTFRAETQDEKWLRISVIDTGLGIPNSKMHRLFSPFDRLDMECEQAEIVGTGLGLPMSKSLVEAMGGKILVESEEGKGSSFIIEFDLTAEMT
ncbi:PAS domain-containing protein [Verrucomicrobia bacterium]|nr:PAS domain-containing protein [Verrucomicrobiota bacterium]